MREMRESTKEEREKYYREEWSSEDLPDYLMHSLSLREFGFDHDGSGPSDRYNQFMTPDKLADFLKDKAPYAVYGSVALYERPSNRGQWLKSELAFDIDAKDVPFTRCDCTGGDVCEICLEDALRTCAEFGDVLDSDLGLDNISYVYSGRGFHIRVFDDSIMEMGQAGRSQIVEYVTGSILPEDSSLSMGYPSVFRERVARTFEEVGKSDLKGAGIFGKGGKILLENKERVLDWIEKGRLEKIKDELSGIGPKYYRKLLDYLTRLNAEYTDGKVTIDKKRILRVPSTLHSTVSRKCTEIQDIDDFSFEETVPNFLKR